MVVVALAGTALAFVGLNDFKLAKLFFLVAAADASGGIVMWGVKSNRPLWQMMLLVFMCMGIVGVFAMLAIRYVDKKKEAMNPTLHTSTRSDGQNQTPKQLPSLTAEEIAEAVARKLPPPRQTQNEHIVSEIEYIAFGQSLARLYQAPPVYFERLDTQAYVSFTNRVGRPLSIREWSFSIMVNNKWVKLKNSDGGGFEPYAFAMLFPDRIVRFNLTTNGFDYVMRTRQLAVDENFEGWLFFNSGGLTEADMKKVQKTDITLVDSSGEKFRYVSDYRPRVIAIPTQLEFLAAEPIPTNLREEKKSDR